MKRLNFRKNDVHSLNPNQAMMTKTRTRRTNTRNLATKRNLLFPDNTPICLKQRKVSLTMVRQLIYGFSLFSLLLAMGCGGSALAQTPHNSGGGIKLGGAPGETHIWVGDDGETLAALINLINEARESHILTVEDPIEFVHPSRRSLVNQRQLQLHTRSYARALRGALREDPDVIVIGELNDPETVSLALEASETGHLVIGTLNSTRAPAAVDRIVDTFEDQCLELRVRFAGVI